MIFSQAITFMSQQLRGFDYPVGTAFVWISFTVSRYYHGYGLFVSGVTSELDDLNPLSGFQCEPIDIHE